MSAKAQRITIWDLFNFETWKARKKIIVKGSIISLCLYVGLVAFASRFEIGMTPSSLKDSSCISDFHNVWLIDKNAGLPRRGELWSMTGINVPPVIQPTWNVVKYVAGVPGDEVLITINEVYVNGEPFGTVPMSSELVDAIGIDRLERIVTLGEGEYFILGDTNTSFDSRYWGVLRESQFIGKTMGII